jgi:subtilisin-like proprotein convertase family protein
VRLDPIALHARFGAVIALTLTVAVTTAQAGGGQRPDGRFDDRTRHREGGAVVVAPLTLDQLSSSDPLRVGWEEFDARHGGGWTVHLDERTAMPTMAAGSGIAWFAEDALAEVGLDELETRVRAFLAENRAVLGDWSAIMQLDRRASFQARNGHWQLVFRQVVDGVRVEDARLTFHVKRGRMVMLGASQWGALTASGVPSVDVETARAFLDAYLGAPTAGFEQVGEPELLLVPLDADPAPGEPRVWDGARGEGLSHALIWRMRFREPDAPAVWVGEVDAHDGSVRAFYDSTRYASVRGGVFPVSADGDCVTGGCEIAGFPMPFADYTEAGQPTDYSDPYGNLVCDVATASFETNLSGPYVHVNDVCGAVSEFGTCEEGLDLGLKHGENCDVAPGGSPGNSAAARTSYYHINRAMQIARFYDSGNTWPESPLTVNVNIDSSCNANWDGQEINMYGAGGNCRNTAELQSILVHEWGHGYDYNDGGGPDKPSEAYADITGILASRDSCMSRGIYADGSTCDGWGNPCLTCTGFRDFDWTARAWNTPSTPTNWVQLQCPPDHSSFAGPCRRQPHCESYISSEAIYDLVTRDLPAAGMDVGSAWQLVDRLWYETRPGSGGNAYLCLLPMAHSCDANSWYQKMRVADDDDGDLSNGTPHAAALYAAFARHGIACGAPEDPENQSTSSCPALAKPALTVTETPGGTELSWIAVAGAAEYRVYRGELGCDRQQVPIASLTGGETTYLDTVADPDLSRYYRIEAFGSNPACSSPVSDCGATPLGARLQKHSHRVMDDAYDTDGMPEPGETVRLPVTLFNTGIETASSTAGTLRVTAPAQVRVLESEATWPAITPHDALESDEPHFELVVLEDAACGDVLDLDLDFWAANAVTTSSNIRIPMGDRDRDFLEDQHVTIPPETTSPKTSSIVVDDDEVITDLDVTVDIFHAQADQLIVELSSPLGTTVRLHDRSAGSGHGIETRYDLETTPDGPGTMDDFVGESTQGTWTLSIQDVDATGPTDNGSLYAWTLHTSVVGGYDCEPAICPEPTPTEAPDLSVDTSVNGDQTDLVLSWDPVVDAVGYHVLQSAFAPFDTAVELIGRTTTETTLTVTDGVNTTPPLTFFQVRGVNACNQEGP